MATDRTEHAVARDQLLRLLGAKVAECVRNAPNAVLIGDQDVIIAPGEPVGLVETSGKPLDELDFAAGVRPEQSQISGPLLRDDDIAVRQHEQSAGVL